MPKVSKYPRLRRHVRRGRGGQAYVYWAYDMRGTGQPDVMLGSDYSMALQRWEELHTGRPARVGRLIEAIEKYREEVLPTLKPVTRRGYDAATKKLQDWAGHLRWSEITVPLMRQYLEARTGKRQANLEISVLSVVWGKARIWGMTDLPWPAMGLKDWKNPEGKRAVKVADEVFDAVIAEADWLLANAMRLAVATGARLTDVRTIAAPEEGETAIWVEASKTGKPLAIRIAGTVLPALVEERRRIRAEHPYLLTTSGGKKVSERMLTDRWSKARDAAAEKAKAAGNHRLAAEIKGTLLRYMRKRTAQLAPSLAAAQAILQHDHSKLTREHYRPGGDVMDPVI